MHLTDIPKTPSFDATLGLLRDGYDFIPSRCRDLNSDVFRTRLMGRRVVCFSGPRGVRLLYGAKHLTRQGAMPTTVLRLLQDKGSVQQLEGDAHRHRKALFIRLLIEEDAATRLADAFRERWKSDLIAAGQTDVMTDASITLAKVACEWAGFDSDVTEDLELLKTLFLMSDRAGTFGPRVLSALLRRGRVERKLAAALDNVPVGSPAHRVAHFEENGQKLPRDIAVVEVLNLLRPIAAVGRYIAFGAARIARDPKWHRFVAQADAIQLDGFSEELRRTSPFFPMTAGITTRAIAHEGIELPKGQWVLADLWGTMQNPDMFPDPDRFDPTRLNSWRDPDDNFPPQGGGDVATTHRCPGERVTLALIASGLQVLTRDLDWSRPEQDLETDLSDLPAQPASGVILRDIVSKTG